MVEETWRGRGPSVGGKELRCVKANGVSAARKINEAAIGAN